jgi:hypothetical protein
MAIGNNRTDEDSVQAIRGKVMTELAQGRQLVITVLRLIDNQRSDWAPDKSCIIPTGWYVDEHGETVFISEQVGEILSWSNFECVNEAPRAIEMYVRVRQI